MVVGAPGSSRCLDSVAYVGKKAQDQEQARVGQSCENAENNCGDTESFILQSRPRNRLLAWGDEVTC
eukprot:COSAG02_NODE_19881_length_859_cov_1.256242_1_plen_66_part_10